MNIANIMGLHLGCKVKFKDGGADVEAVIETVAVDAIVVKVDSYDEEWDSIVIYIDEEFPKILLKPLSKITDEDIAEFRRLFKIKEKILGLIISSPISSNGAVLVCTEFTDFDGDPMDKYDDITSTQLVWLASKGYDIGLVPDEYKEVEQ